MSALDDSIAKLNKQLSNLKGVDLQKIALAAGYKLLQGAQERSPVLTGALRQNQEVVGTENGAEYHANQEYAFYVEMGTSKMPAQPFVRPTIDEDGDDILKAAADEAEKQIREKGGK